MVRSVCLSVSKRNFSPVSVFLVQKEKHEFLDSIQQYEMYDMISELFPLVNGARPDRFYFTK